MKIERKGKLPADVANSIRDPDALSAEFTLSSRSGVKIRYVFPIKPWGRAKSMEPTGLGGSLHALRMKCTSMFISCASVSSASSQ